MTTSDHLKEDPNLRVGEIIVIKVGGRKKIVKIPTTISEMISAGWRFSTSIEDRTKWELFKMSKA